ncbi:MAG: efflux RND transporter periplasmic adaptor subunit [Myxococcales bacterium]|nr:efflux RND transporter periplasmic adaptor subunit [Myxococcales bacterium]
MKPIGHPGPHLARHRVARRVATVVALAAIAAGAWFGYHWWRGGPTPTTYTTVEVGRGDVVQAVTATGTLSPVVTVEVGSQVSGRVKELLADYNDHVTKGQVLARLDPAILTGEVARARARLTSAKAELTRAQATLTNARAQYTRTKGLADEGLVAAADVDTALAAQRTAEASVSSARAGITEATAALAQAEVNVGYTTITSPIDGVVISRSVDVGQTVAASLSAPVLFVLAEDLRRMEVHTSVAESDVGQLRDGMQVELSVDAFPDRTFVGTVAQVRYEATTVSNVVTYDAVVAVDNADGALRPGMTVNATFLVAERRDVLTVPVKALRYRPAGAATTRRTTGSGTGAATRGTGSSTGTGSTGARRPGSSRGGASGRGSAVWVLRDGAPVRVHVETGLTDGSVTEISGGELAAGDLVITGDSTATTTTTSAQPRGGAGGRRSPF